MNEEKISRKGAKAGDFHHKETKDTKVGSQGFYSESL